MVRVKSPEKHPAEANRSLDHLVIAAPFNSAQGVLGAAP
jgi:hypothetical protein